MSDSTLRVTFEAAGGGPTLKGVLHLPEKGSGPFPAAVVCHPHTLMGGDMGNGVVVSVCAALAAGGWAALRFDFRGAGGSEGSFDEGEGERDDVQGAVDFLLTRPEIDRDELAVVGYSFGAGVALRHAAHDQRLRRMVAIALVQHHYDDPSLDHDSRPKLFVAGENDPWAPAEALHRYVERLQPPKVLHVVPGADHFFSEELSEVAGTVADWLTE
jgi:alpha/beta superfamily hydrolase